MDIIGYPLDHLQVFFSCSFTHHPHRATLLALLFTAGAHGTATVGKKKSRCTWARGSEGRLVHLWCIFDSTKTSCLFCLSSLESTMWVSNPQVYSIQITKGLQVEVRTSLDRYLSGGKCAGVVHQRKDTTPNLQIRALRYLKIHCQNLTSQTQPW